MSELPRSNRAITLAVTCLGSFMLLLDTSIVTLALPRIQMDLHTNLADLQWAVDAYILPFAVLMLTGGNLGDRFGRKKLFLSGLLLFIVGSALSGSAQNLNWLLIGRAVQGVGAAALSPGSLSLLVAAFPDARTRAQAIGAWGGISGIALAIGPLAGGVLVQFWNWPAIFWVNVPLGLIALVLAWPGLTESRNPHARHFDLPGQVLVIAGLTCLVMATIESSTLGWSSPIILGLLVAAVVLLIAFILVETRVREPLLPLPLFKVRAFSAANIVTLLTAFATLSTIFFVAHYFQQVQGYSVLDAGLRTFPISMGAFLMAPIAGGVAGRIGSKLPMILGSLLCAGAIFLLIAITEPGTGYGSLWWVLAIMGLGLGLILSPATAAVFSATPANRTGLGASMYNTSNEVGNTLGVAVIGALVVQQFSGAIASQLTQHGISASLSASLASKVAASGAQASQLPLPANLPLSATTIHQIIAQAFVDALHGSFLVSAICLLVSAVVIIVWFKQTQPATDVLQTEETVASNEHVIVMADGQ